jgi:hypothetical protein
MKKAFYNWNMQCPCGYRNERMQGAAFVGNAGSEPGLGQLPREHAIRRYLSPAAPAERNQSSA